ncbi:MAG: four helix bundle protein [Opitutae bacterium]|nr:four helix bundle protein [Opitutae bacterium]
MAQKKIVPTSEGFHPVEDRHLCHLRRCSYAPEGAKRRYPAHFTSKLTDADAELQETQHWLLRAKDYGYLSAGAFDSVWQPAKQVGRRLGRMLNSGDWS